jgi:hypothetical protein
MVLRTSLLENINVSAGGNFSFYGLDSKGRQTGTFYYSKTKKPLRLTNLTLSLDFSLDQLLKGKEDKKSSETSQPDQRPSNQTEYGAQRENIPGAGEGEEGVSQFDEFGYMEFDVPWSMNVAYSINYSKPSLKSEISQTLMVNGSLSITKKMNITYNTGYDFRRKEITMTQISVTRDLHCWDMAFNWIPNGNMEKRLPRQLLTGTRQP